MRWLENLTGGYSSGAKVINETLVLSLPNALSPVVWRMNLSEIKAAAFEIESKNNETHTLVMKTSKKDPQEIASFDNKSKALKALMSVSQAMEQAYNAANDDMDHAAPAQQKKKSGQLTAGIVGVLILGALIFGLTQIGPEMTKPASSSSDSNSPNSNVGVPVSADDFLKNR